MLSSASGRLKDCFLGFDVVTWLMCNVSGLDTREKAIGLAQVSFLVFGIRHQEVRVFHAHFIALRKWYKIVSSFMLQETAVVELSTDSTSFNLESNVPMMTSLMQRIRKGGWR